jgi:HSP20 family molecular chaperone IbpA
MTRVCRDPSSSNSSKIFHRHSFLWASCTARSHRHVPAHLHLTDESVQLTADVPGIKAQDLNVQVDENVLSDW